MVIRNGLKTKFWKDTWCDEQPLQRVYPLIYSLASNPGALVRDYSTLDPTPHPGFLLSRGKSLIGKFKILWLFLVGSIQCN